MINIKSNLVVLLFIFLCESSRAQDVLFAQPYLRIGEGVYLPAHTAFFNVPDFGNQVFNDVTAERFNYKKIKGSSDSIYLGQLLSPGLFRIGLSFKTGVKNSRRDTV